MSKKVVILNGSPRRNGNTSALTAAFKKGAEEAGHTVSEFHLSEMKINGCLGCWHGGRDMDHPCTQRDDMEKIYPAYVEADVVVLASPLYYWFVSGFLKNAFDRLFAIAEHSATYRNPKKDSDHLQRHIGWKNVGKILCPFVTQPGDIKEKKEVNDAYLLGKSL